MYRYHVVQTIIEYINSKLTRTTNLKFSRFLLDGFVTRGVGGLRVGVSVTHVNTDGQASFFKHFIPVSVFTKSSVLKWTEQTFVCALTYNEK